VVKSKFIATALIAFVSITYAQTFHGTPKSNATIIENTGFTIGYSDQRMNPLWVAYRVYPVDDPVSGKRPSKFKVDQRTESKISHKDYTHSGYDRGHMAPNYAIATRYGREAQLQTFLMSNICPQTPKLNRQIWKRLEMKIAKDMDEVWVVTGPIFDNDIEKLASGVEIPDAFYKIIADDSPSFRAYIIPQDVVGSEKIEQFVVSVDSIENVTHIDFFWELDDALEDSLEAVIQVEKR